MEQNFTYKVKKSNKNLQQMCLNSQLDKMESSWAKKIKTKINKLEIKEETKNSEIKERLREEQQRELEKDINTNKTVIALKILGKSKEEEDYIKIKNRKVRREIANFRLGGYLWKSEKDFKECRLCGGEEGFYHWIRDCKGLEDLRDELKIKSWEAMYYGAEEEKIQMASFLRKIRKRICEM